MASTLHPLYTCMMTAKDLDALLEAIGDDALLREHILTRVQGQGLHIVAKAQGQIVAAGGIQALWPGVGEAWLWTSPVILRYRWAFYRAMRRWLDDVHAVLGLHRMQCFIRDDLEAGHRLMRHLSWWPEGRIQQYGPDGADYRLYAWTRPRKEADGHPD